MPFHIILIHFDNVKRRRFTHHRFNPNQIMFHPFHDICLTQIRFHPFLFFTLIRTADHRIAPITKPHR